jgi:hypothetical protein
MADWVWYLGAGALGVGGLWLFWWAWWGDRARGRARCGRCWYSMDALMGGDAALPVCPECGWRGKRRDAYLRARRRRVWACLAVLIAVGAGVCGVTPKIRRDGVWSIAPDALVKKVATSGLRPSNSFVEEMVKRFGGAEWLNGSLAQSVYRENRWLQLTRAKWVKGVPLRARVESSYSSSGVFSGLNYHCAESNWGLSNSADPWNVQSHENWWDPGCVALLARPIDAKSCAFGVEVSVASGGRPEHRENFASRVELVDSLDQVMSPVRSEATLVRQALNPSIFVLPSTSNLAMAVSDLPDALLGRSAVLGLRADLQIRGRVVASARWYQESVGRSMTGRPVLVRFGDYESTRANNGPMTCTLDELLADGCVVRFSTDEEMALAALECEKYWRGSFEVPLRELVK